MYFQIWCINYSMMSILLFASTLIYLLSRILMVIVIDVPSLYWRLWKRISRETFSTMGYCWCKWLLQLCCIPGMACSDWQTQVVNFCRGCSQHLQWILRKMNEHAYTMLIIKVETGRVDGQRLCVTGESAGGFTTLACLAFRQTFKAGSSLYGASFGSQFLMHCSLLDSA